MLDCVIDKEFVDSLKLMMLSFYGCSCKSSFFNYDGSMSLEELFSFIYSGAQKTIQDYCEEHKEKKLTQGDFPYVFCTTKHIDESHDNDGAALRFGHVLSPIIITSTSPLAGIYKRGNNVVQVSGLFDPEGKIKENDIVLVHFSMVVMVIDENLARKILQKQSQDENFNQILSQIKSIDYKKDLNDIYSWTKLTYNKYKNSRS